MTGEEIRAELDAVEREQDAIKLQMRELADRMTLLDGKWWGLLRTLPARERIDRVFGVKAEARRNPFYAPEQPGQGNGI